MLSLQKEIATHNSRPASMLRLLSHRARTLGGFIFLLSAWVLCAASPSNAQTIPTAPAATGTAHSSQFTWTAAAPVTGVTVAGYNLYCSATSGGESGTPAINGATLITGTSYTDLAVTSGTKQFCVFTAQSSTGAQSAFSTEVSFTTPVNPNPITGLAVVAQ